VELVRLEVGSSTGVDNFEFLGKFFLQSDIVIRGAWKIIMAMIAVVKKKAGMQTTSAEEDNESKLEIGLPPVVELARETVESM
jgi:hypothetical protein